MLTTTEAARVLGVTPDHVRYLCRTGALAGRKLGRDWLLEAKDVEKARRRPRPGRPTKRKRQSNQPGGG